MADVAAFTSKRRRELFLQMARDPGGTSTSEVYARALELGDTVTEEAYHNIARRLAHAGLLTRHDATGGARYVASSADAGKWLEEDDLASMVDPDYPLEAVAVWKESARHVGEVPESAWEELRERLRGEDARDLFTGAIISYADDLHAQIGNIRAVKKADPASLELSTLMKQAEYARQLLQRLARFGLGLSREAVVVPPNIKSAVASYDQHKPYVTDASLLREEIERRVASGSFIVDVDEPPPANQPLMIGGVDGSSRSGVLTFVGESGDQTIAPSPIIAINTAVGQTNAKLKDAQRSRPVFVRLPEKPEDMQRQDNRHTVMAKLLHPDLSDAQYMHSVWNAMDLIEARAALRLFNRWYSGPNVEVPPCEIVFRDGAVSPQDRDHAHYRDDGSYGRIVRDMIDVNWQIARKSRDDDQTLAGVVKNAQLTVFAPVVNWYAARVSGTPGSQIEAWPMNSLNVVDDQLVLTRLLTAGRRRDDPWARTCVVLRPFHAVTNFATRYSRERGPVQIIEADAERALAGEDEGSAFWANFRAKSDPYVQMLRSAWYGSLFVGYVPRLDTGKNLPRCEFLVVSPTAEDGPDPWGAADTHLERMLRALRITGFDVSAEHTMFGDREALDVLPKILIDAHDTVKLWAADLMSRVQEYVGYYLARYVKTKRAKGARIRPFTRAELELLYAQLRRERELRAGSSAPTLPLASGDE